MPAGGELSDELAEAVGGGQPLVLTWRRQPAAVVLDVESYLDRRWVQPGRDSPSTLVSSEV